MISDSYERCAFFRGQSDKQDLILGPPSASHLLLIQALEPHQRMGARLLSVSIQLFGAMLQKSEFILAESVICSQFLYSKRESVKSLIMTESLRSSTMSFLEVFLSGASLKLWSKD